jgi:xanthine/CO dehydrogenase XdhC/CoxF family maturation factor
LNLTAVQDWATFEGDDEEDTRLCRELLVRGQNYLESFKWCERILERYVGLCIGGIVAVTLFRIEPRKADEWIWVVVGDLPAAYISVDGNDAPPQALRAYIEEMRRWVAAARDGGDTSKLIPVNVEPTAENAERLARRLDHLEREILPEYE